MYEGRGEDRAGCDVHINVPEAIVVEGGPRMGRGGVSCGEGHATSSPRAGVFTSRTPKYLRILH